MRRIPIDAIPGQGETIRSLRAAGLSGGAIGRYVGRNAEGVRHWLLRRGLWQSDRMTDEEIGRLQALWADGCGVTEIATELGRPVTSIDTYLRRSGLLDFSNRCSERTRAGIVALYDRGLSTVAIAERFHVSRSTVQRWRDAAGRRKRRRLLKPDEVARIVAMYEEGALIGYIAAEIDRPYSTVWHVLKRVGVHDPTRVVFRSPAENHPWRRSYK